ncbi:hypothetical protein, partial [Streptomyces sp. SM12]
MNAWVGCAVVVTALAVAVLPSSAPPVAHTAESAIDGPGPVVTTADRLSPSASVPSLLAPVATGAFELRPGRLPGAVAPWFPREHGIDDAVAAVGVEPEPAGDAAAPGGRWWAGSPPHFPPVALPERFAEAVADDRADIRESMCVRLPAGPWEGLCPDGVTPPAAEDRHDAGADGPPSPEAETADRDGRV